MKNIYALKNELDDLSSLKELTESLNYMSAAKMMKLKEKVLKTRTFLEEALKTQVELQRHIVLLKKKDKGKKKSGKSRLKFEEQIGQSILIVAIMSDQGLCGIFNSQIAKKLKADFEDKPVDLLVLGKKGRSYFGRSPLARKMEVIPLPDNDDPDALQKIFAKISSYGTVYIYFNKFINAVKTDPVGLVYRSMSETDVAQGLTNLKIDQDDKEIDRIAKSFVVEPTSEEVSRYFQSVIAEAVMLHEMLESQLSENNARMLAMKEASDNINELVVKQKKLINQTRRRKINQSLSELFGSVMLNG